MTHQSDEDVHRHLLGAGGCFLVLAAIAFYLLGIAQLGILEIPLYILVWLFLLIGIDFSFLVLFELIGVSSNKADGTAALMALFLSGFITLNAGRVYLAIEFVLDWGVRSLGSVLRYSAYGLAGILILSAGVFALAGVARGAKKIAPMTRSWIKRGGKVKTKPLRREKTKPKPKPSPKPPDARGRSFDELFYEESKHS